MMSLLLVVVGATLFASRSSPCFPCWSPCHCHGAPVFFYPSRRPPAPPPAPPADPTVPQHRETQVGRRPKLPRAAGENPLPDALPSEALEERRELRRRYLREQQ